MQYICISCKTRLTKDFYCSRCKFAYPVQGGIPCFTQEFNPKLFGKRNDFLSRWQLKPYVFTPDYDERAFYSLNPLQRHWQRKRYRIIKRFTEGCKQVLDIGCGSSKIIQDSPHFVGIDVALPKLQYLKTKIKNEVACASIYDLPFLDESFDCVVCSEVIEHIPRSEKIFTEFYRVLKKGGTLVLGTPDYNKLTWVMIEKIYGKISKEGYAHEHISHYTKDELYMLLQLFRFKPVEYDYIVNSEIIVKAVKK